MNGNNVRLLAGLGLSLLLFACGQAPPAPQTPAGSQIVPDRPPSDTVPSGGVDASFKPVKPDFTVADSAVQADGKIVVFGTGDPMYPGDSPRFVLARYNADGSADGGFGDGGKLDTFGGSDNTAYRVLVQADGKILAAGGSHFPKAVNGTQDNVAFLRLLPNGQPDASFGTGGVTFAGTTLRNFSDFAAQQDGKIVVVEGGPDFSVVRLKADGSLDKGFGKGGRVTTVAAGAAQAVAVQGDGKIVAGGAGLFARYNPDGSLDSSFGSGGKVATASGPSPVRLDDLLVQADGRILAAGAAKAGCSLERLNANGSPDEAFDQLYASTHGGLSADPAGAGITLALQEDQKIVLAGCTQGKPGVFRLQPSGAGDAAFGQDGFAAASDNRDVNIQPGGKILVGLDPIARLFP